MTFTSNKYPWKRCDVSSLWKFQLSMKWRLSLYNLSIKYSKQNLTCWNELRRQIAMICPQILKKAMAPHSSTLAWKIPWTEEPGRLPWSRWESDPTEWLHFHFSLSCIGEGNGNPLQCSCLENPRDGGAWWAALYGVAQSQTWLKRLSSSSSSNLDTPS